jgi:class 3 adenylate cyclase/tetratricopeptide (TPR) repeat protein
VTCPCCGASSQPDASFCEECGGSFGRECPSCRARCSRGAKFCRRCGAPLGAEGTRKASELDPRSYTPRHLAEKILTSRSAIEGERKQVTVLFADVKESMNLATRLDPEEWHAVLDGFFRVLTDGIHRFEGTVNQYTGDGVMALFGAPIAHEDHASRACYTALDLRSELRRYAEDMKRRHGLSFATRIGIHSGEVVVGKIGDDLRMDYTAQGETVGLASRLEQLADPGSVYVSEATARLIAGYFVLRDLGTFSVKGLPAPARVYELEGTGRLRTRLEVAQTRGLSKFVGREREMQALESALERALGGSGQVVGIVADPGVGKSRLCLEFVARCRERGLYVNEGHCPPHGKVVPYLPILELWRSRFGIGEKDSDDEARRKIAGTLLLLDEGFRDALPVLFEFLGVADPQNPPPKIDPEAKQRQLLGFLRRLTHELSDRAPFVILIDDLHWVDRASDAFVAEFAEAIDGRRVLFLVNFRPEYEGAWMRKSYYQQIALSPLSSQAVDELLEDLLGSDQGLEALREGLRTRSGGNPFFLEEAALSLIESGVLAGARGRYRLTRPIESVEIPATVQVVLAARIDRLSERDKALLQAASVVGKSFAESILRRVVNRPELELLASLGALRQAEFIYEESVHPETIYAFKHPLTHEVAYKTQLAERRMRTHAAVASAIEEAYPEKLDERAADIARHWEHAGEAREAAKWHRRAAEWVGANNSAEGLRHWGSVRQLRDTLPETPENLAQRAAVRAQIMLHLSRLGDLEDQATSLFREGKELATRSGDPHVLSQVLNGFGLLQLYAGAVAEALDPLLESIRRADETEDIGLRVAVRYGLSGAHYFAGRLRECLAVADQGLGLAQGDLDLGADRLGFSPSLGFSWWRGAVLSLTGRPREGAAELDRVIKLARTSQQLSPLFASHAWHVLRCEVTGEVAPALAHGREAVDYAERAGHQMGRVNTYLSLGLANVLNGAWHEALEVLETALTIGRERRLSVVESGVLAAMAEAHLGLGDRARALTLAEEGIAICQRRGARLWEFSALLTRIRALRETQGLQATKEIAAALAEADAWLETSGAKSYEPFLHVERAELARLTGDDAARQRELREAHRLFTEIGAPIRAEQVARELGG